MDVWTWIFVVAALVGFGISTAEVTAMVINYQRLTQTVKNIKKDAADGMVEGLKNKEVRTAVMTELKPLMKDAIDQDMLEAWGAMAMLALTNPEKPYMAAMADNIKKAIMGVLFNGPKGQAQKEINEMTDEIVAGAMDQSPLGQIVGQLQSLVPEDSKFAQTKWGKALRDPAGMLKAVSAAQQAMNLFAGLGNQIQR